MAAAPLVPAASPVPAQSIAKTEAELRAINDAKARSLPDLKIPLRNTVTAAELSEILRKLARPTEKDDGLDMALRKYHETDEQSVILAIDAALVAVKSPVYTDLIDSCRAWYRTDLRTWKAACEKKREQKVPLAKNEESVLPATEAQLNGESERRMQAELTRLLWMRYPVVKARCDETHMAEVALFRTEIRKAAPAQEHFTQAQYAHKHAAAKTPGEEKKVNLDDEKEREALLAKRAAREKRKRDLQAAAAMLEKEEKEDADAVSDGDEEEGEAAMSDDVRPAPGRDAEVKSAKKEKKEKEKDAFDDLTDQFSVGCSMESKMPKCMVPFGPGKADTNAYSTVFILSNGNMSRLRDLLQATLMAHGTHNITVTRDDRGRTTSVATQLRLPVTQAEVAKMPAYLVVQAVAGAFRVCDDASLLGMNQAGSVETCKEVTVVPVLTKEDGNAWQTRVRGTGLGVHHLSPVVNYPAGTVVAPVLIEGDKKNKSKEYKLSALRDAEVLPKLTEKAQFKLENDHIVISYTCDDGTTVKLTCTTKSGTDYLRIPICPGRDLHENWLWIGQFGVGQVRFDAEMRPKFNVAPRVTIKNEVVENKTYYYHRTCLTANKTETKPDKKESKGKECYVFFTARRSMIVIEAHPTAAAGRYLLGAIAPGTQATKAGAWPIPGRSTHVMSDSGSWLKAMDSGEKSKALVTPEKRAAAMEAWKNVDLYHMLMGTACPMKLLRDLTKEEEAKMPLVQLGTAAASMFHFAVVWPSGLSEHLIPLLYEMFTVARAAHGISS